MPFKNIESEIDNKYVDIQKTFINKIYEINKSSKLKAFLKTYGCQMNAHDSDKILSMLELMGYKVTFEENEADLIIYNTCCVRENAENKIFGHLGYLKNFKKLNKNLKIILCGCMMQQGTIIEKIKQTYSCVDIIFGTYNAYRFPELLYTNIETGESVIDIWKDHRDIEDDLPYKRTIRHKASVNIMYGCNKFCTYCIVPYVRGRERSRSRDEIIKEIVAIANDGVKEITLLGQNVNSYGLGLKEKVSFANILQDVCKISGIERVRFMTSYPNDFTDELIQVIKNNPQICKYIHLPVQSGSNRILKCMKRGYSREEFLNLVYKIRASISGVHLTTDIIVGFPGETEEDFSQTLDLVKEVEFLNAYTFIYSKREGTRASIMDEQVPESISRDRFNRLIYTLNSITKKIMKSKLYTMEDILVDGVNEKDDKFLMGRTDSNILVYFRGHKELIGNTVKVRVVGTKTFYLNGEVL